MNHGTRSCYVHHKCRCELCRGAQAAYQRELYAKRENHPSYKAVMNRKARKRQQLAAAWVKENRGDVWQQICDQV